MADRNIPLEAEGDLRQVKAYARLLHEGLAPAGDLDEEHKVALFLIANELMGIGERLDALADQLEAA